MTLTDTKVGVGGPEDPCASDAEMSTKPRLNYWFAKDDGTGYGRMGIHLAKSFEKHGVEVYDRQDRNSPVAPAVLWASHPNNARNWYENQYRVLLTMWEGTRLPELLRENLHMFDLIIVPSMQNLGIYSAYHPKVVYTPLGVDPDRWRYRRRQKPRTVFRFMADGRGARKGTDVTVKAFKAAFDGRKLDGPMPRLLLKGRRTGYYTRHDIEQLSAKLTAEQEVAMYGSAHCWVAPSRGEGFGLQPLQAIAQGIPTILSDAHGQASYAHLGWPITCGTSKAEYFLFGDAGDWWEPSLDEVIENMRWVYDNFDLACSMAKDYSDEALAQFNWDNTAKDVLDYIRAGVDLSKSFDPGEWVEPQNFKLYPVIMKLPWRMETCGKVFHFEPNKLYWERAEIKGILFESGWLDPACYEIPGQDSGLQPNQIERFEEMQAEHGACPYCGQTLNSKPLHEYEDMGSSGL